MIFIAKNLLGNNNKKKVDEITFELVKIFLTKNIILNGAIFWKDTKYINLSFVFNISILKL